MMNRSRTAVAGLVLAGTALQASAAFVVPNGVNYAWTRGTTAKSSWAEWNVFTSVGGPNSPDVGTFIGGAFPETAPAFNVFDSNSSSGSFITSGGNIYSFSGVISPQIEFGNFGFGTSYNTTILIQVRTLGNELNASSVTLNGSIAPVETTELARSTLGGFGGFEVDTLFRFELTENLGSYVVDFDAQTTSMSLDRVAIDTYAFIPGPSPLAGVPSPGVASVLGLAALTARTRRRR